MIQVKLAAQLRAQLRIERLRPRVAIHDNPPVMPVNRLGRNHHVHFFAEALLPERHADGFAGLPGIGPYAPALHQRGGLLPEKRPRQIVVEPAAGHHAVARRRQRCAQRGLRGARQRQRPRRDGPQLEPRGRLVQLHQIPAEAGGQNHQCPGGGGAHGLSSKIKNVMAGISRPSGCSV